ncbi:helix-turn-helix domain-containing protein [Sutcliffiella halmapala]|uniref:helix-turn-helix domain-containing protein n=1 Tax=Sutcliffiella halmapala TaxID=79882 RepID=UPI0009955384|nr:helix-turn-helix domain-containing protein [Sutcliffiella halmapala]
MKSFEFLCLYCIDAFRGERTISAVYHLLKGKKSSQTIQDGNLFSVAFLFGLLPDISRKVLGATVTKMEEENLVTPNKNNYYILTQKGKAVFSNARGKYSFSQNLNGWLYKSKATLFWKRYSLLVQTLSNIQKGRTDYIPVQYEEKVQSFVKRLILKSGTSKKLLIKQLYEESYSLLEKANGNQAYIFVAQLSGYRHAGLTIPQLSKKLSMDETWVIIEFQTILHFILQEVEKCPDLFPLLNSLCMDIINRPNLTSTTQKSLYFLEKGYNLDEIATIRNLKISTIEDHIVELALQVNNFSLTPYVTKEKEVLIQQAIHALKTNQLKRIKDYVAEADISYFQIRLVLTKMGDMHDSRKAIER